MPLVALLLNAELWPLVKKVGTTLGVALRANAANLLTALRIAAAAGWLAVFRRAPHNGLELGAIASAAALTDFIDGRVARRFGASGAAGRWLDSAADIIVVLTILGSEARAGAIPFYIPLLIAVSFAQYAADSIVLRARASGPIPTRLGHWGGVLNYALALALSFAPPPSSPATIIKDAAPLFALFYIAAIAERAILLYVRPRKQQEEA